MDLSIVLHATKSKGHTVKKREILSQFSLRASKIPINF